MGRGSRRGQRTPLTLDQAASGYRRFKIEAGVSVLHTLLVAAVIWETGAHIRVFVVPFALATFAAMPMTLRLVRRDMYRRVGESRTDSLARYTEPPAWGAGPDRGPTWRPYLVSTGRRYVVGVIVLLAGAGILAHLVGHGISPTAFKLPLPAGTGPWAAPVPGEYTARATIVQSVGFSDSTPGETYIRAWNVTETCATQRCAYSLTRTTNNGDISAPLELHADGWEATFPPQTRPCRVSADGLSVQVFWNVQRTMVLRFNPDLRTAIAAERGYAEEPDCGYGEETERWTAVAVGIAPPNLSGPATLRPPGG